MSERTTRLTNSDIANNNTHCIAIPTTIVSFRSDAAHTLVCFSSGEGEREKCK
jgi:hypothetical protein